MYLFTIECIGHDINVRTVYVIGTIHAFFNNKIVISFTYFFAILINYAENEDKILTKHKYVYIIVYDFIMDMIIRRLKDNDISSRYV